ncbi:Propanediol dehydratase small subunit [Starkeya nomas]|uniref:Propanediol dehydratase small subunit n=2 Tax=Xanthobacteraceae TaxID=335928 RepID=A0A5S9NSY4_9HYPH|nr:MULTISPECIES: diol dehydratase small subunit [Xanthobacteraceae]TSJ62961.1 glycerol dehydratase [Ancylobacter moscoviensis]CAA0093671.1 Propanediol dehydratase small subunit [Starkeya nomas]
MSDVDLYPVAEKAPEQVRTPTGKPLSALTLEAVMSGEVDARDVAITPEALLLQARIARAAGRVTLAENFERAADLVRVPQDLILDTYELLRPGRARDAQQLLDRAAQLRRDYGAERVAALIEEAAAVYTRRGLFVKRY